LNSKENNIIYFILGVITAIFGIPVLQSLSELVCGKIEAMKMPDVEKVTKGNLDLQKLQENSITQSTSCIGFEVPNIPEEDEE
jgi:hypothetical protein